MILWVICALIWVVIEGNLQLTLVLAVLTMLLIVSTLVHKFLAGRTVSWVVWLLATAVLGIFLGLGSGLLTILLMAIKTGLHAHGPEFSAVEVNWIVQQIPLWVTVGCLAGLGLGLVMRALSTPVD